MDMQKPPQVKITTKERHTDIYIDDFHCHHVTGILATWDNQGWLANVTVSMLAEIDIDSESAVLLKLNSTEDIIRVGDTVKTDNVSEGFVTHIEGEKLFMDVNGVEVSGPVNEFKKVRR